MAKFEIVRMGSRNGHGAVVKKISFFGLFTSTWAFVPKENSFGEDRWCCSSHNRSYEYANVILSHIHRFYAANYHAQEKKDA